MGLMCPAKLNYALDNFPNRIGRSTIIEDMLNPMKIDTRVKIRNIGCDDMFIFIKRILFGA